MKPKKRQVNNDPHPAHWKEPTTRGSAYIAALNVMEAAIKAARDHLTPDDIAACLRHELSITRGTPERKAAYRRGYDVDEKAGCFVKRSVMKSINEARQKQLSEAIAGLIKMAKQSKA